MEEDELATTLAANAAGGQCADPDAPLQYDDEVLLAFCVEDADRCRDRAEGAPTPAG